MRHNELVLHFSEICHSWDKDGTCSLCIIESQKATKHLFIGAEIELLRFLLPYEKAVIDEEPGVRFLGWNLHLHFLMGVTLNKLTSVYRLYR